MEWSANPGSLLILIETLPGPFCRRGNGRGPRGSCGGDYLPQPVPYFLDDCSRKPRSGRDGALTPGAFGARPRYVTAGGIATGRYRQRTAVGIAPFGVQESHR